jgi:nucleotide-binding universal stress UspA family protein
MYARILVPIDGSATSNRGLTEAINLAKDQKAKLRLLHVIDQSFLMFDAYGMMSWDNVTRQLREGGETLLAEARSLAARSGVEVEGAVVESLQQRVADKILADAQEWRPDLIVMGTHGRRGFGHLVLGSDAEAVLHGASVPVLLIKAVPAEIRAQPLRDQESRQPKLTEFP